MSVATNMLLFSTINASRSGAYTGYSSSKMSAAGGMGGDPFDGFWFYIGGMIIMVVMLLTALVLLDNQHKKEHSEFLQRQGCVFYAKGTTGVKIRTGKSGTRDQIQTVYLCKDGPLTEVD
jgi:hypothetical protein